MDEPVFTTVNRKSADYRPVAERLQDYREVSVLRSETLSQEQASRCLNCGLPFCHWTCPVGSAVPAWNEHLAHGRWAEAYRVLQDANNMPEITGRICPASCENACVLGIGWEAVTIRDNELAIIEHAFQAGYVQPHPPPTRSGRAVAVVGSGPAGLACADQLNQAGHRVVVFERDDKIGGLLRYGIPDFKLEKRVLDRRTKLWEAEGIEFVTGAHVGVTHPAADLRREFDAICVAGGARVSRDLPIPGRDLRGIHVAMDYLVQSNRRVAGERIQPERLIDANGKQVVVIGGGDTGADCVGTANRQGARRVVQLEILPQPPAQRGPTDLWPDYPKVLRTSSSHEEGAGREWSVLTKAFLGARGSVERLRCIRVEWTQADSSSAPVMQERPGAEFEVEADLVLLAMGFVSPERQGLLSELGVTLDARGNAATNPQHQTSVERVFAAGDMRRGQSLVVWAIREGRAAAHHIDRSLMGSSSLPLL